MIKLDIKGDPTPLTLYEVWEAVVALTATCVRRSQKCGKASGLGLHECHTMQKGVVDSLRYWP